MDRKPKETPNRTGVRWLLLFYDTLILGAVWCLFHFLRIPDGAALGRWHFILLFFCFTAFRMVFRVYRQIWRVGAVQSFAREMAADLAATAACALIYVLMGGVPALSSLFLGFGCTVASLAFRIAYVCLYRIAKLT